MIQIFKSEWEITKTYIYDVALNPGMINLNWDDFKAFAEKYRPVVSVKNEGASSIKELVEQAISEISEYRSDKCSNIIASISYNDSEGFAFDEMEGVLDCLTMFANEDMEIKWGISQNDTLKSKRCISIFVFE